MLVLINDKQKNVAISKNTGYSKDDTTLISSSLFFCHIFQYEANKFWMIMPTWEILLMYKTAWWPNWKEQENGNIHEKKKGKKDETKWGEFSAGTFESGRG